ncbi:transcriptional regulator, XRE family protein [bacterium]|nr:transcriptional regulator, XRE family protein [bacterium]
MAYTLMTDEEILHDLARKVDLLRRNKNIKDTELVAQGGTNRVVLNKFRKGQGGISLRTFIRILRGLGELDRLETCFRQPLQYSPTGKNNQVPVKRVRDKKNKPTKFVWGEDQ